MCANTLVAVTTCAWPHSCTTRAAASGAEKAHDRADAAFVREVRHQCRLDAAHRMARGSEVLQERAVVRSDIDDQLGPAQPEERRRFALQLGEIFAKDSRRAAGVRILRREEDRRIDDQAQLHELARRAAEEFRRIRRLLVRPLTDRPHLVDRRQIAEEQHRLEIGRSADLAAIDDDAAAGARGAGEFLRRVIPVITRVAPWLLLAVLVVPPDDVRAAPRAA